MFTVTLLSACKKDDTPYEPTINPPVSDVPQIELLQVSPVTVTEFEDSLSFLIKVIDGNGDIGEPIADSVSLLLTDNRVPLIHEYHIQPMAPLDAELAIEAELNIVLRNVIILTDGNQQEKATFSIKLKDRAGNWSNEVTSGEITIIRP